EVFERGVSLLRDLPAAVPKSGLCTDEKGRQDQHGQCSLCAVHDHPAFLREEKLSLASRRVKSASLHGHHVHPDGAPRQWVPRSENCPSNTSQLAQSPTLLLCPHKNAFRD